MATEGEREREGGEDSEQHGKVLSISWPGDCGVLHISCVARVPGWQLQGGVIWPLCSILVLEGARQQERME